MSGAVNKSAHSKQDLIEQYEYIARDSVEAAERFLSAVETAVAQLAGMPRIGAPWKSPHLQLAGVRTWLVPRFPNHVIFYREREDGIEVLRVLHGARDIQSLLSSGLE